MGCLGVEGMWWRELREWKKPPSHPGKQRRKQVAPTLLDLKIAKNAIFDSIVLGKISKMFFEEQMNDKIFCYLRRCGVIPVQSLHPLPPGLEFALTLLIAIIFPCSTIVKLSSCRLSLSPFLHVCADK
jgi:hypothetical protein